MIDHLNLTSEINNNLLILQKNSVSEYYTSSYSGLIDELNRNANKFKPVDSKGRGVFIGKIKFNIISEYMQHYINILTKYNNKKIIYIYNENKKHECQNNTNNNIDPKTSTINYEFTAAIVPSTTYIPIPVSSEISTAYKIITSPKIISSTINFNNNFSVNYITSTPNILLPTQSNKPYNYTTYNRDYFSNDTVIKAMNYSNTSIPYNLSRYYYPTNKNKTNVITIHNNFYKKVIISISIILPILIILISGLTIYKYYYKSKTKQIINNSYIKNCNNIVLNTQDTAEYHIYEIPNNHNYQQVNATFANNNYEEPNDSYEIPNDHCNNISSNDSITECSDQHEYIDVLSFSPNEKTIADCSLTEDNNDKEDNYNSQNNFSDRIYNVLEDKNSIIYEG